MCRCFCTRVPRWPLCTQAPESWSDLPVFSAFNSVCSFNSSCADVGMLTSLSLQVLLTGMTLFLVSILFFQQVYGGVNPCACGRDKIIRGFWRFASPSEALFGNLMKHNLLYIIWAASMIGVACHFPHAALIAILTPFTLSHRWAIWCKTWIVSRLVLPTKKNYLPRWKFVAIVCCLNGRASSNRKILCFLGTACFEHTHCKGAWEVKALLLCYFLPVTDRMGSLAETGNKIDVAPHPICR